MSEQPFAVAPIQGLLVSTPPGGFVLANGTPVIWSWTAPTDGQLHRVSLFSTIHVATLETGGLVQFTYLPPFPGLTTHFGQAFAAGLAADTTGQAGNTFAVTIAAGSTVQLVQASAVTAGGPSTVAAELWGS